MIRIFSPWGTGRLVVLPALLSLSFGGVAVAQDSSSATVLKPIVVLENQEDTTGSASDTNNPPTVTGSKVPVYATEVPLSRSILGEDDLKRFSADRVSEAVRYAAGVTRDLFGDDND